MSEIQANNSGSDISVDSWTLLDDKSQDEDLTSKKSSDLSVEIIDMEPEVVQKPEPKKEESEEEGFLAFDEFFQEKVLQYDYEHAEKAQKKGKKKGRKFKTPNMGISVFITIILGLTVFATLCSTITQIVNEKKAEEVLPVVHKTVSQSPKDDEIFKSINATIKELETFNLLKEIEKISNDTKQCPRKMPPRFFLPKVRSENFKKSPKITPKPEKVKQNDSNSWIALKEYLLDTNFHAVISLIMTNIYLFNLLFDIAKKPVPKKLKQKILEDLEKAKSSPELRKFLFKELPFFNSDFSDKKPKKLLLPKPKKTTTITILNEKDKLCNNYKSCPFLAQKSSLAVIPVMTEEAGKSECQRRFDELDLYQKTFEELRQSQRHRVKLLKQKFKNEVSYIKDTEEESEARAQKINRTSQRFIKKLKFNRERYLLELKKVKDLRQKVAEAKKKEGMRDVSSGSYEFALPAINNYSEKFKAMKDRFEKQSKLLPNEWKFQH